MAAILAVLCGQGKRQALVSGREEQSAEEEREQHAWLLRMHIVRGCMYVLRVHPLTPRKGPVSLLCPPRRVGCGAIMAARVIRARYVDDGSGSGRRACVGVRGAPPVPACVRGNERRPLRRAETSQNALIFASARRRASRAEKSLRAPKSPRPSVREGEKSVSRVSGASAKNYYVLHL